MGVSSKAPYKVILFVLVLLPIYQDSPLSLYLGAAGYTFVMPLSLILIVLYILFKRKFPENPRLKELIKLGIYLIAISFIGIIVWLISGNSITVVSEFLPVKAIKVILQYFSYPSYIALIIIAVRKTSVDYIGKYSFVTIIILTIICLIEMQQSPYAFQELHFAGTFPYWRIRLLTAESSYTAVMIYVYSALSLCWSWTNNKFYAKAVTLICVFILFMSSGSRSLLMTIAMTAVLYLIISIKKLQKKALIGLVGVSIAGIVFAQIIMPGLIQSFANDIEYYTSIATRAYTGVIGLLIGVVFPCGVGGAVYLGVLQSALSQYLFVFSKLPIMLNTSEIISLATNSTDVALTVKSGILHFNMYWGILGTIYLLRNFISVSSEYKKTEVKYSNMLLSVFWCTIALLIFSSNFSFEFWLLYSFLLCINESRKEIGKYEKL